MSRVSEPVTPPLPWVTNLTAELCSVWNVVCKVGHPQTNMSKESDQDCRQSGTRERKASLVKIGNIWSWSFRGQYMAQPCYLTKLRTNQERQELDRSKRDQNIHCFLTEPDERI